jgi:hypothetical protein
VRRALDDRFLSSPAADAGCDQVLDVRSTVLDLLDHLLNKG